MAYIKIHFSENMGEFTWAILLLSLWNKTPGLPGISSTVVSFSFAKFQAVDIFTAWLSSPEKRLYVAGEIARILGDPYQGETVQHTERPIIQACAYSFLI